MSPWDPLGLDFFFPFSIVSRFPARDEYVSITITFMLDRRTTSTHTQKVHHEERKTSYKKYARPKWSTSIYLNGGYEIRKILFRAYSTWLARIDEWGRIEKKSCFFTVNFQKIFTPRAHMRYYFRSSERGIEISIQQRYNANIRWMRYILRLFIISKSVSRDQKRYINSIIYFLMM